MSRVWEKNEITFLDGAMGTMVQAAGLQPGAMPELLCITNPTLITEIHRKYVDSGSEIIYTNTLTILVSGFGSEEDDHNYSWKNLIGEAIKNNIFY